MVRYPNSKIEWDKRVENGKTDLHSYSNIYHYRMPIDSNITLMEIEEFCKVNSYNWNEIRFEGFGIYGGVYMGYFYQEVGIGD